jgi:hypothetical protein
MTKRLDDTNQRNDGRDANPDPITGEPGSHPVGTGLGAASGGLAAGAAMGAVAGPVGAAVGAVVGGIAGGLAGKGVAESIDPTAEEAYWRKNYGSRPYAKDASFDDYQPAYQYGWEARGRANKQSWGQSERDLGAGWDKARGKSKLDWEKAKHAARDAWDRVERALPGDADGDGR